MKSAWINLLLLSIVTSQMLYAADTDNQQATPNRQLIGNITSQSSIAGPEKYFTGEVIIHPLYNLTEPVRSVAYVTFHPSARSAWHTHPKGQLLIVTDGVGLTQQWGGKVTQIKQGDVVWCPPGVKHWHGATAHTSMTHISIVEELEGKNVNWLEKVTDDQYKEQ